MLLDAFKGHNIVIAKDQPEYMPLPAYRVPNDQYGRLICCWKLSWRERLRMLWSGRVWHTIMTFNQPLQPQLLEVQRPDFIPNVDYFKDAGSKPT